MQEDMANAETAARQVPTRLETIGPDVGRRIRAARLERGMSLAQLGGRDLSRSFLSLVELGRSRISLRALSIVADRLDLPLSYFLDDAPGVGDAAIEMGLDEAEVLLIGGDAEAALRRLEELRPGGSVRTRGLWLRGRALVALGRPLEAISLLPEVITATTRTGDTYLLARALTTLGEAHLAAGNDEEGRSQYERALEVAEEGGDPVLTGLLYARLGQLLARRGDTRAARKQDERAVRLLAGAGDAQQFAANCATLARASRERGNLAAAVRYSHSGLGALLAREEADRAAQTLSTMATRLQSEGNLESALERAAQAVGSAQRAGYATGEAVARGTLATILLQAGRQDEAMREAEAAVAVAGEAESPALLDAWLVVARVAEAEGDVGRSDEFYNRALGVLERAGNRMAVADTALEYSLALRKRGDTEHALDYALKAAQAKGL